MEPLQIVLAVVGVLGVQGIALVAFLRWMRRRTAEIVARLARELDAAGERTCRGPEAASYRGGSGGFSSVKGNGVLALTDRRLLFAKLTGPRIEVSTHDIAAVREDKRFRGRTVARHMHVIVKTRGGDEVGFFVEDHAAWLADLGALATGSANATTA